MMGDRQHFGPGATKSAQAGIFPTSFFLWGSSFYPVIARDETTGLTKLVGEKATATLSIAYKRVEEFRQ